MMVSYVNLAPVAICLILKITHVFCVQLDAKFVLFLQLLIKILPIFALLVPMEITWMKREYVKDVPFNVKHVVQAM